MPDELARSLSLRPGPGDDFRAVIRAHDQAICAALMLPAHLLFGPSMEPLSRTQARTQEALWYRWRPEIQGGTSD